MKLQIKDIIDKHKWKKAIVIGLGPSLNLYRDKLKQLKDSGYILIGCNTWFEFYPDATPHYWVNANSVDGCYNRMAEMNRYKSTVIFADTVEPTDQNWIDKNIQTDYLPYDQRHFEGKKCNSCGKHGCEKYYNPNRLTIQEELQNYTGHSKHYNTGHTVIVHSIAFSILMGFSEIYLIGVDFDYRGGYASNLVNRRTSEHNHFDMDQYGKETFEDIDVIAQSAKKVNTKIFNANPNSYWKTFDYKEIL